MKIGTELARVTVGIDRLYRRNQTGNSVLDQEGLIPVSVAAVDGAPLNDWIDATRALDRLQEQLPDVSAAPRRTYVGEMIDSLRTLVLGFRGKAVSYAERIERGLRLPATPVSPDVLATYQETIAAQLQAMGYSGADLGAEIMRWEQEHRVPETEVLPALKRLLAEARTRTATALFAPPEDTLEPVGVRNVPFAAYCDYPGRKLILNLDYGYTMSALKHLACHEGYPGHFLHLAIREDKVGRGEMPLDAALVVTSSASSALFEGIAENGIDFLAWVEEPADVLALALNRLRSAARINAAWMIHAEGHSPDDAVTYLMESCFKPRAWAESRVAFLTHPLRAPFIFAYWYGDMAVHELWQRVSPARRSAFWDYLYHHMHTPATLAAYWT